MTAQWSSGCFPATSNLVEASMNYFVLRYLGFRPTLYDGSYVEWNKSEPVASAGR